MTSILKVSEIQDPTNSNSALTIDSSGHVLTPKRVHVRAIGNSESYINQNSGDGLPMSVIDEDGDGNASSYYNTSTGLFTAPVAGVYFAAFTVLIQTNQSSDFQLNKNGSLHQRFYHTSQRGWHGSTTVLLEANDTLVFTQGSPAADVYAGALYSHVAFTHLG